MTSAPHHPQEASSNTVREQAAAVEPRSLRTYTPTLAVLAHSAGPCHWTPEGRRLFDFSSGVLVANLGHNPTRWLQRFTEYMGWKERLPTADPYFSALPLTAYNAITPVETDATKRLVDLLQSRPGGKRLEQVLLAASGS